MVVSFTFSFNVFFSFNSVTLDVVSCDKSSTSRIQWSYMRPFFFLVFIRWFIFHHFLLSLVYVPVSVEMGVHVIGSVLSPFVRFAWNFVIVWIVDVILLFSSAHTHTFHVLIVSLSYFGKYIMASKYISCALYIMDFHWWCFVQGFVVSFFFSLLSSSSVRFPSFPFCLSLIP